MFLGLLTDGRHHTVWPVRVHSRAIWQEECDLAFQRLVDKVCTGHDFIFVYLDDILVVSTSVQEHKSRLRQLFLRLSVVNSEHSQMQVW